MSTNPDPTVIRAFARLFLADATLTRPPRELVKDMLARIESLEHEREHLYNIKERMWEWKTRAHVFAQIIRAQGSVLYLECESCSWMTPATELNWDVDQAVCPTCGATEFLAFRNQIVIGGESQPREPAPAVDGKAGAPTCKFCGQQFDKGSTLFQHIKDAHPAELDAQLSKHFPELFGNERADKSEGGE